MEHKNMQYARLMGMGLILVGACAGTSAWAAAVAQVNFAVGPTTAVGPDGKVRPLAKGDGLNVGDMVSTGTGRLQLRFTDGGLVSLQPQSSFKIDEYSYGGKADESEKGTFSLLKGALRTITGAIGRRDRASYRMNTEVATIGIRGTEYLVSLRDSLSVSVGEGAVALTNKAGELVVFQGQSAYVADATSLPVITFSKPSLPPEQAPQRSGSQTEQKKSESVPFVSGEQVSKSGVPVAVGHEVQPAPSPTPTPEPAPSPTPTPEPAPSPTPTPEPTPIPEPTPTPIPEPTPPPVSSSEANFASFSVYSTGAYVYHSPITVGFNSSTVATQLYDTVLNVWIDAGTTTVEGGTAGGGVVGWTRWSNGDLNDTGASVPFSGEFAGVHHVVGQPTPLADLQSLNGVGATGSYAMIGFTRPTFSDGVGAGLGSGAASGNITVNFGSLSLDADLQLSFQNGSNLYRLNTTGIPLSVADGRFASGGSFTSHQGTLGDCVNGCHTSFSGFMAGANAGYAAGIYLIDSDKGFSIQGATAFQKQ